MKKHRHPYRVTYFKRGDTGLWHYGPVNGWFAYTDESNEPVAKGNTRYECEANARKKGYMISHEAKARED